VAALLAGGLADSQGFTRAMLWTIPFPWLICALIYSLFYWTYPRDAARLRELMAGRADEIQGIGEPYK
jgi:hypothetical protein